MVNNELSAQRPTSRWSGASESSGGVVHVGILLGAMPGCHSMWGTPGPGVLAGGTRRHWQQVVDEKRHPWLLLHFAVGHTF